LTRSKSVALLGRQTPRYQLVPRAKSSAGPEAVELSASHGLVLEPHQELVLQGSLGENPNPKRPGSWRWAAFEVAVVEPRQNGKGGIITARELAGLYLFNEPLQTHTAHRFDTCLEGFRRIREIIDGHDDLRRRVKRISDSHGQESIELYNRSRSQRFSGQTQRLNFKARSKGSGRGFSGDVVYLDEAFWLLELGSLMPTMSARPNPQLWYLSSAPLPRLESEILRRLCKRGRAGARRQKRSLRLAYFEWCAELGVDPTDRGKWDAALIELIEDEQAHALALADANPGLGYRLSPDFATSERTAMTTEEYARERLGIYPEEVEVVDLALDPDDWRSCTSPFDDEHRPLSGLRDPVTLAFEVSHDRKWAQIAAGASSTLGAGKHVEVIENRRGTGWLVDRLVELVDRHKPIAVVCLPGAAAALLEDCKKAGLTIGLPDGTTARNKPKYRAVTAGDWAQACGAAYDDITEHRWVHIDQPELNKAVASAVWRTVGDARVFDRRSEVDISPLAAVTLAAWAAGKSEDSKPTPAVHTWADDDEEFNEILRELEQEEEAASDA